MFKTRVASFSRSQLRQPAVVEAARTGPVDVNVAPGETLVLLPERMLNEHDEVARLTELFLRVVVTVPLSDSSPVVLGELAFIARRSDEEQRQFVTLFAEALEVSVRLGDPRPARFFLDAAAAADELEGSPSSKFTGRVSDATSAALEDRLATRE